MRGHDPALVLPPFVPAETLLSPRPRFSSPDDLRNASPPSPPQPLEQAQCPPLLVAAPRGGAGDLLGGGLRSITTTPLAGDGLRSVEEARGGHPSRRRWLPSPAVAPEPKPAILGTRWLFFLFYVPDGFSVLYSETLLLFCVV
jgi:hypothetical protein